jgi:hypothetical protein
MVFSRTWHALRHVANVARHVYVRMRRSDSKAVTMVLPPETDGVVQCILSVDVLRENLLGTPAELAVLLVVGD